MSKVTLPPGKKPLPVIRCVRDAVDQVEDYAKLLEWLLAVHLSAPDTSGELLYLGALVQQHADKFSNIQFLNAALGVYNDIKHARSERLPPTEGKIFGAAKNLERAIVEILPLVPEPVQRAVQGDFCLKYLSRVRCAVSQSLFVSAVMDALIAKLNNGGRWSGRRETAGDESAEAHSGGNRLVRNGFVAVLLLLVVTFLAIVIPNLGYVGNHSPNRTSRTGNAEQRLRDAKEQQGQADREAARTLAAITDLERECASWSAFVSKLLSDDVGKRLAASSDAVRSFDRIRERPLCREATAKIMRQSVQRAIAPTRAAISDPKSEFAPLVTERNQLERLHREAQAAMQDYRDARRDLDKLLARHSTAAAGTTTLQQAIDELGRAETLARAEAEHKIAEETERRRVEADKAAELRKVAAEKRLAESRVEYRRLRVLAEDTSVQEQFAPFFQSGNRIPYRDYQGVFWRNAGGRRNEVPAGPIPYDTLVACRVFKSVEDMIAVGASLGNDRPTWQSESVNASSATARERFELFKQVAPVWHDMGLLGPRPATPHVPNPDEIVETEKQLAGEWQSVPHGDFGFRIDDRIGVATKTNAPKAFRIGDETLRLDTVGIGSFSGRQLFTDGEWYDVQGALLPNGRLRLTGLGQMFDFQRR